MKVCVFVNEELHLTVLCTVEKIIAADGGWGDCGGHYC